METYNSKLPLPLTKVPLYDDIPQELENIHDSITALAELLAGVEGGLATTVIALSTVTTNYTAGQHDYVILIDTTDGDVTITLPISSTAINGKRYEIKAINTFHNAYIAVDPTDAIDGDAESPVLLTFPQSITVVTNQSGWWIV